MNALHDALLLAGKDLRVEWRVRQSLVLAAGLGVLIIVMLALGLREQASGAGAAAAVLWVAYLFAGVLCFERTIAIERGHDALAGLLMTQMDRGTIFLGKLISNGVLLLALAAVITPVAIVLLRLEVSAPGMFAIVTGCGLFGLACIGTLLSAASSSGSASSGLLAMLVLPLSIPIVLASMRAMAPCLGASQGGDSGGVGLGVLVACDAIFFVAGWFFYELLLE